MNFKKLALVSAAVLMASSFVNASEFRIEKNQRFAAGSYGESQNMFVSDPYLKNADRKYSCGVNLWVENSKVEALFSKDHDGQFFFLALGTQTLDLSKFQSSITPYVGEECLEYSESELPEDSYCVRSRPVYGQNNTFIFSFENKNIKATVACSKGEELNTSYLPMSESKAKDFVRNNLAIQLK